MGIFEQLKDAWGHPAGEVIRAPLNSTRAAQHRQNQQLLQQWAAQYDPYQQMGLATGITATNVNITLATYPPPSPTKPAPRSGEFRRGKVPEGEYRYSESPLAWLDERVDEMRLVL